MERYLLWRHLGVRYDEELPWQWHDAMVDLLAEEFLTSPADRSLDGAPPRPVPDET